jgi:tagaturonate reductase
MVILPTELIPDNGHQLKAIIMELAAFNELDTNIINWIQQHNTFCNTLVDRIVPGKPVAESKTALFDKIGYTDELISECEPFSLWAIEAGENLKDKLTFAAVNPEIIIHQDINTYRELKLRLLNGTHTFNCGLAFLSGIQLTRDAVNDPDYKKFMLHMMHDEIAAAIPYEMEDQLKSTYVHKVVERFANPYINHQWLSISAQYSFKMKTRNLPVLLHHFKINQDAPQAMAAGFAGYILFMKPHKETNGKYFGIVNGTEYPINDDAANILAAHWEQPTTAAVVQAIMEDEKLWGANLHTLNNWTSTVAHFLNEMMKKGVMTVLKNMNKEASVV